MATISLVRRGSVILRGISLLGYVLCSQQSTVITPDEFEDYSLELLVEPVRGANSSTERHNIAAHTLQTIIGGLDQVLCAMYARRPNPDADIPPLDRHHNGGRRGDQAGGSHNFTFYFRWQDSSSVRKFKLYCTNSELRAKVSNPRGKRRCDTLSKYKTK